jgi:hypothetical protein
MKTTNKKRPFGGVLLFVSSWIVLGHLGGALHVPIQRFALDQPGSADLYPIQAALWGLFAHVPTSSLKLPAIRKMSDLITTKNKF